MFRLVDASQGIREAVPAELVPLFWAVTLFGSAKFLLVALSLAYWNLADRRDELLALVSLAFVALTLTLVLKYGFDMPRPPESVQRYPIETSDVGFPSGHAIAATVIYGGLVVALDRARDPRAVGLAALAALAIGLSRVVLGVHYLGDVLAGWAVGLVVLVPIALLARKGAIYGFAAAGVLSLPALVVTGANPDSILALGGSLGGLVGTLVRSPAPEFRTVVERATISLAGVVFVVGAVAVESAVESVLPAAAAVNFLIVLVVVVVPMASGRLDSLGPASRANW